MIKVGFEAKGDELSDTYEVQFGPVYALLVNTGIKAGLRHPLEFLFEKERFYRRTYIRVERRLIRQKQSSPSDLERISNQAYQNR